MNSMRFPRLTLAGILLAHLALLPSCKSLGKRHTSHKKGATYQQTKVSSRKPGTSWLYSDRISTR